MTRRCLVVSAVNFTEGGPITVLRDFVAAACAVLPSEWRIVVFLHDTALLQTDRAELVAIPYARASWLRRLKVEWHEFRAHAERLQPDLWVSLHDISPNVGRFRQAVYCHNPSCFFRLGLRDALFEPSLLLFQLAYSVLYRIRLKRNCAIIVQQSWLRDRFRRWAADATRIIVAHPSTIAAGAGRPLRTRAGSEPVTFFYPALPRPFKNFELICAAVERLECEPRWQSRVLLTIDGAENRYSRWLVGRYSKLRTVRFIGRQTRAQMDELYASTDCLIFPSRMETWGLPISEAKSAGLPMFIADLDYARETVGSYAAVDFIDVADPAALAAKLLAFQLGTFSFRATTLDPPAAPYVRDWPALIEYLRALTDIAP